MKKLHKREQDQAIAANRERVLRTYMRKVHDCPNPNLHEIDATVAKEMMAWIEANKLYPGKRGSGKYTKEQLALFDRIKKDIDDGDFVTVSSKKVVAKSPTGVGHSGGESMGKGLVGGHAYTVIDYKPKDAKPGDVRFVKLRNPWGQYGRRYVKDSKGNWKAVEVKKGTGEFWLELSDLSKRFYAIKKAG